jgi:hypothetical protein
MKTKRKYHDDDIFDDDGLLKDGKVLRVKLTMADGDTVHNALQRALQERDSGPLRVVDGFSRGRDSTAMHRPGYRIFDGDDAWEHQKARMYAAYDRDLRDQYKNPTGFGGDLSITGAGEKGSTDQDGDDMRLCPDCDATGKADAGSECQVCGGTGLVPHNSERSAEQIVENASTHHEGLSPRSARRADSHTVRQPMADHERKMEPLYEAVESELREKWRQP